MTAQDFADAIKKLIRAAREAGLLDAAILMMLEDAVESLDQGMPR
jgi:hypothetical protein